MNNYLSTSLTNAYIRKFKRTIFTYCRIKYKCLSFLTAEASKYLNLRDPYLLIPESNKRIHTQI